MAKRRRNDGEQEGPEKRNINLFISYASEDKQLVTQISSELRAAFPYSLDIQSDDDFKLGDNWKNDIENSLDQADILLVVFTERPKQSFSFTGYEIGYFNSSIKRRPNIKSNLNRIFIPLLVGDVNTPDTMYYTQGAKLDSSNMFKVSETSPERQNNDAWSRDPANPIVKLLNRVSDIILATTGSALTSEKVATIQNELSKSAKVMYGQIHAYLQGRVFSEKFPERKLVIRSPQPIEFQEDGANLINCRIELHGKSFDAFGIPENAGTNREFSWSDFLARMNPAAIGPWRESIRLLVSSVLQGGGDNYIVISTIQKDVAYRLFVSRIVTYVSQQTEIHIYAVEIKTRSYGDRETTQLLQAVSTGVRFRFLVLEKDSDFTPLNLGYPTMTMEALKPKVAELLSQMNLIIRDAKQAGLDDPQFVRKIWEDGGADVQNMMVIWERSRSALYSTADGVLQATQADFAAKKAAFVDALTTFCNETGTMNREYTSKVMHLLADKIAHEGNAPAKAA